MCIGVKNVSRQNPEAVAGARLVRHCKRVDSPGKRLAEAMKVRGVGHNELDRMINKINNRKDATKGSVSRLLKDGAAPPGRKLGLAICEALNINWDWLLKGEGPRDAGSVYVPISSIDGFTEALEEAKRFDPSISDDVWSLVSQVAFVPAPAKVTPSDLYKLASIFTQPRV